MKSGGADVRVIRGGGLSAMESQLISDARNLASTSDTPLAGYAIVTWDASASAGYALKFCDADEGGVYPESIPSFASGVLGRCMRRHGLAD